MGANTDAANRFRKARDLGCEYLLRQYRNDGGFGDPARGVADYYKAASALQVCGETAVANRLCQWIRRHGITAEGDFGPRQPESCGYFYAYYNCWVILGAHRLGQYDLSQRGMDFLAGFHDPRTGGFYSSLTDRREDTLQDIWVVSGCAQAALATGRLDMARSTGKWFREVLRQQPDFPRRLFGVFSRARGLITNPDPAADLRYVASQDAMRDQYVFNPGIAAGFLCRLYQATGEPEWLELARQYMRFAEGMNEYLQRLLRSGKVTWAASLLYTLTGEEKYRSLAVRVGTFIAEAQEEDGAWRQSTLFQPEMTNDITNEMVVWMDEAYQALAAAPPAGATAGR